MATAALETEIGWIEVSADNEAITAEEIRATGAVNIGEGVGKITVDGETVELGTLLAGWDFAKGSRFLQGGDQRRDGGQQWLELSTTPVFDEALAVLKAQGADLVLVDRDRHVARAEVARARPPRAARLSCAPSQRAGNR